MAALRALRINKSKSYNSLGDDILPDSVANKPLDDISEDKAQHKESSPRGVNNPFGSVYWKAQRRQKSLVSNGTKKWAELDDADTGIVGLKGDDGVGVLQIPDATVNNGIVEKKTKGKVMEKWKTKFSKDFSKSKLESHATHTSDAAAVVEPAPVPGEDELEPNNKLEKTRFGSKLLKDDIFAKRKHEKNENGTTDTIEPKALAHEKQPWEHNLLKAKDSLENELIKPAPSDPQNKDLFKDHNIERFLKEHLDRDRWGQRLIKESGACTSEKEMQTISLGVGGRLGHDPNILPEEEDCSHGNSHSDRESDDDQFQVRKNLNLKTGLTLNVGKKFLTSSSLKIASDGMSSDTRAKNMEGALETSCHNNTNNNNNNNNNNNEEIIESSSQDYSSIRSDSSDPPRRNKETKEKDLATKLRFLKDLNVTNVKFQKQKKSLLETSPPEGAEPNNRYLFLQQATQEDWESSYKSTLYETTNTSLDWNSQKMDLGLPAQARKVSFPSPAKKKEPKITQNGQVIESPRKQSIKKLMAKLSAQKTLLKASPMDAHDAEYPGSFPPVEVLTLARSDDESRISLKVGESTSEEDWRNEEMKLKEFNYLSKMKTAFTTLSPKKSSFKSILTSSEKKLEKMNKKSRENSTDCAIPTETNFCKDLGCQLDEATFKMCTDLTSAPRDAGHSGVLDTGKAISQQPDDNLMMNFDDDFTDIAKRSNHTELEFSGDPFSLEYINPFNCASSANTNPFDFPGWENTFPDDNHSSSSLSQPQSSAPSNASLESTSHGQNIFFPPPQPMQRNSSTLSSVSEPSPFPLTSSTSMWHLSKINSDPFTSQNGTDLSVSPSLNHLRINRDSLLDLTEEEVLHEEFPPSEALHAATSSKRAAHPRRKEFQKAKFSFSSSNLSQLCEKPENNDFSGSMWDCSYVEGDEEEAGGSGAAFASPHHKRKKPSKMASLEHKAARFMFGRLVSGSAVRMPTGDMPEAASLLGGDGPEELRSIQLSVAGSRTLVADGSLGDTQQVETEHGPITIAVSGDPNKPTILTYHDLGLNHVTNFQSFFLYPEMRAMLHSFRVVSVNAPGQEEGAPTLPEGYVYPTMDQLAETVDRVRQHLGLRSFIGLGVGLGANVLARYALLYPQQVDALLLINCSGSKAGWLEWGYQKLNIRQLKAGTMTTATVDYLLWHCFGKTDQCQQDLVTVFRQHFESSLNATNLGLLIDAYIARTDLGIQRELDPLKKKEVRMLRCPILNMTSNYSQHIEDSEAFNGRLDPVTSNYMKLQDSGMVLEEQPGKVVEAFRLFLQGQGYALHSRRLNCRQNSLPLIRDVYLPKPSPELLSSLKNAADDDDDDSAPNDATTTNGDSAHSDVTQDDMDGVTVNVLSGSDKDIRITENPLEHPAV